MYNLLVDVKFRIWGIDLGHVHHVWSGSLGFPFPLPAPVTLVNFNDHGVNVVLTLGGALA